MTALTADKLAAWRADFLRFTEACPIRRPDGTVGPVQWSPVQLEWVELVNAARPGETVACIASKRAGKTLLGGEALLWSSLGEDRLSICLSNSRESAQSLSFSEACTILERSPLADLAEVERNRILFPDLRSEIRVVPASPKTCAGITPTGLLLSDELWIGGAEAATCWDLLSAQAEQAVSLLVSQPSGMESPVRKLYDLHETGADPTLTVHYLPPAWYAEHGSPNPYLSKEFLHSRKVRLGDALFATYFGGAWGEAGQRLWDPAIIERAFSDYALPRTRNELLALLAEWTSYPQGVTFGAGLDRSHPARQAELGDRTAWATVARLPTDPAEFLLVAFAVSDTGHESEVLSWARGTYDLLGYMPPTLLEAYEVGDLSRKIPNAEVVWPTSQRQAAAWGELTRALNEGRVHLSAEAELLRQELAEVQVSTESALPKYGSAPGAHDDTAYGLLWAVCAAQAPPPPVSYQVNLSDVADELEALAADADDLRRRPGRDIHHR